MPFDYEVRRTWKPQNRPYEATTVMLRRMLPSRPVQLMCIDCHGLHTVSDPFLVIRCRCGCITVYRQHVLFFLWSALTWLCTRLYSSSHFEAVYDPYREAMRFYATSGPRVEHNTTTIVTTQVGSCVVNELPVSLPTVSFRELAWRRFRSTS